MLAIVWCATYHKHRYFRESGISMYTCQYVPQLVYIPINIVHICHFSCSDIYKMHTISVPTVGRGV